MNINNKLTLFCKKTIVINVIISIIYSAFTGDAD